MKHVYVDVFTQCIRCQELFCWKISYVNLFLSSIHDLRMFLIFVEHYVTMIIWLWEENWYFTEYLLCVDLAKCKDAESYKQIIFKQKQATILPCSLQRRCFWDSIFCFKVVWRLMTALQNQIKINIYNINIQYMYVCFY